MDKFQPGDIVERVSDATLEGSPMALFGRYVVQEISSGTGDISIKKGGTWWMKEKFILVARGVGLELSQFINRGSQ